MLVIESILLFFFFQAEDGIRDADETGVQTCALPISATDPDGRVVAPGDAYSQTVHVLRKIEAALEKAGARLEHVVRTRIFVTNGDDWERVGTAHVEFFRDIRPASTLVQVSRLVEPEALVEIEVDAVIPEAGP